MSGPQLDMNQIDATLHWIDAQCLARRQIAGGLLRRLEYNPLKWDGETAFGRALQPHRMVAPWIGENFDLTAGNGLATITTMTPLIDRIPAVKNIQFAQSTQLLFG